MLQFRVVGCGALFLKGGCRVLGGGVEALSYIPHFRIPDVIDVVSGLCMTATKFKPHNQVRFSGKQLLMFVKVA